MAKKGFLDGYQTYDTTNSFGNEQQWREAFRQIMSRDEAQVILQAQAETPHAILGVSPGATAQEITTAFRRRIMEWHPDKNQHRIEEAEAMSKKIIAAYTLLTEQFD